MIKNIFLIAFQYLFLMNMVHSQVYNDYIGAGHNQGIIATSSNDHQRVGWSQTATAEQTLSGAGLEGKLSEAGRFLMQAAISHDLQEMEHVADIGIEPWINEQINQPYTTYLSMVTGVWEDFNTYQASVGLDTIPRPSLFQQNTTWWRMNMTKRDFLRDKIAFALSEIFVISTESDLNPHGFGVMDYYDIFKKNAFGNFKDILKKVSLHPAMGVYLSHYSNSKVDTTLNIFPDENFAREIMQLFSIGLYELNIDGSHKTDANGESIPTYNNADIKEMAKVWTGLGPGAYMFSTSPLTFGAGIWHIDHTVPMGMYEMHHDTTEKVLLNGLVIPAGQQGMTDIDMAIDYLFNHPNVGPLMSKRLIQLFVKSNPSPAYVSRVASVFNADINGQRGNMEAVIKQILLDDEARTCTWITDPSQGKLKNPTERAIQFTKIVDLDIQSGEIWTDAEFLVNSEHRPLAARSVFNFHAPDYVPPGPIGDANMVAPEFQIYNTASSTAYTNSMWWWFNNFQVYGRGGGIWQDSSHIMNINFDRYLEASQDVEVLINQLDLQMTNGNLHPHTRSVLKNLLNSLIPSSFPTAANANIPAYNFLEEYPKEKVKQTILLILLSPDFNILK